MTYPNFISDRDGLDRWRAMSREGDGHEMVANKNTVFRFVQTVDALEAEALSLRADNERMRGALEPFAAMYPETDHTPIRDGQTVMRLDRLLADLPPLPELRPSWAWKELTRAHFREAHRVFALSSSPDLVGLGEGNHEDMAARDQSHTATAAPVASDAADQQHPGAEQ